MLRIVNGYNIKNPIFMQGSYNMKNIREAASSAPDPQKAERSLQRLAEVTSGGSGLAPFMNDLALLFSSSRFLANFCISIPDEIPSIFADIDRPVTSEILRSSASKELMPLLDGAGPPEIIDIMKAVRLFRKRHLTRITVRFLKGYTDIVSSMNELTCLAETVISFALEASIVLNYHRFGEPDNGKIAIIALGKLGAGEINYSSDVDLMAVYNDEEGRTSGILNPSGVRFSRISNHEFYCKTIEILRKLLSSATEDGIGYRVDLRLRPQGQRGELALPLRAYQTYYESWGRTWERMALIRARHVAGDASVGMKFIEMISPFVWKRTMDYAEIDEIRSLKKKIDSTFAKDDIKRGYGGIREAEFFIHTFQLLYGGENERLRSGNTLDAIEELRETGMIAGYELDALRDAYLFLRTVEQYLQMDMDLQTHSLPAADAEMLSLARKMSFEDSRNFIAALRLKRMQIKNMYNSLLGSSEDVFNEVLNLLAGDLSDEELKGFLSFRKANDPERCVKNIRSIGEHMSLFKTIKERGIIRDVIPRLVESAMSSDSPDRALSGVDDLLARYRIKTVQLTALKEQKELMEGIVKIFSLSPYLSGIFLSRHLYLNILIEEWGIHKSYEEIEERLDRAIEHGGDFTGVLAEFRRLEEIRLGMLFLQGILDMEDLFKALSNVAEATVKMILKKVGAEDIAVIALGKLGGREVTFGSDLDIVFVSDSVEAMSHAEKVIRALTSYTEAGRLYSVDTRLRPDGSKGILVNNPSGYRNYYLQKAHDWEIQALLKARPLAGDQDSAREFMSVTEEAIRLRGQGITHDQIIGMRDRIIREISEERQGIDIKLGPGGIEEIEFYIQYLQLRNAGRSGILEQNTLGAMDRLEEKGILESMDAEMLRRAYSYMRKAETFLRLNEEQAVSKGTETTRLLASFMKHSNEYELTSQIEDFRHNVMKITRPGT
jgi:glutamate-ammonia-ligase adenylyltransferase